MVVTKARLAGISRNKLIEIAQDKKDQSSTLCSGEQINPCPLATFSWWLRKLSEELGLPYGSPRTLPTENDIIFGLELYSHLVYCSKEAHGAVRFVEQLLENDNPATLLLATANTIQGDTTKDPAVWRGFRDFYPVLERELGLQYGRILLAIVSPLELQAILRRDWPYLDSYSEEAAACLLGDCGGVEKAIGELGASHAASLFSPHLLDQENTSQPFALIPFCAYQGNMSTFGHNLSNINFAACSSFKPNIIDGKTCFTLKTYGTNTKSGEMGGTLIMLDPVPVTPDLGFLWFLKEEEAQKNQLTWMKHVNALSSSKAGVYLSTLERFRERKSGTFALSALKKITGTHRFLTLDDAVKNCSLLNQDVCQRESFLEQMEAVCGCLPWSLSPALTEQEQAPPNSTKAATYCTPAAFTCNTNVSKLDFGCKKSCTGLYADVQVTEVKDLAGDPQILNIIEEYKRYKYSFARNIIFDADMSTKGM